MLARINAFLESFFTPFRVKWGGIVLALLLGGFFLRGGHRIGYFISILVAIVSFLWPHQLWHWLANFADEVNWPAFVALGVAIVFAAHQGGAGAALAVVGPLATYDGMYFEQNY